MYIMTIVNVFALVIHTMFNKSWIYVSYMHAMCIFNIFITYKSEYKCQFQSYKIVFKTGHMFMLKAHN